MTSANSLYLPINSINLAHYFKSGIILPTKLIKNRYSDIQNQNSDFLLLSTNKWVDDSDCSIEVVLSNVDKEKIIKISKNFLLYHFALPISRIKAIYFKNLEQSKVTITNINISTAFIPDHLISIEKNKNIEPISSIEAKSYTITEEPDNKKIEEFSRKFDRILGSLALMRLAGNFPKNYSDNYFHTLSHFNEAIRRDSQKHQEELALKAEDKYLELFFNQGNKDFSELRKHVLSEITIEYLKNIAKAEDIYIEEKKGVVDITSLKNKPFLYFLAILALYGSDSIKCKKTEDLLSDLLSNKIAQEKEEDILTIFGFHNGYSKISNGYKNMGKYEIIKFTLKNKLDYYIIESVYQNAFIKEPEKGYFDFIDTWLPQRLKNTEEIEITRKYETCTILDTLFITQKKPILISHSFDKIIPFFIPKILDLINIEITPYITLDASKLTPKIVQKSMYILQEQVNLLDQEILNQFNHKQKEINRLKKENNQLIEENNKLKLQLKKTTA
jgi:hypothetical protein